MKQKVHRRFIKKDGTHEDSVYYRDLDPNPLFKFEEGDAFETVWEDGTPSVEHEVVSVDHEQGTITLRSVE